MVRCPDIDTYFVNIEIRSLHGVIDLLALLLLIITLDYVLRTSIDSISQKSLHYRYPKVYDIPALFSQRFSQRLRNTFASIRKIGENYWSEYINSKNTEYNH